ncbi:MAG: hypothetical protein ACJA0T_003201 [Colwellia sp.]|jgi:hypothetical protein
MLACSDNKRSASPDSNVSPFSGLIKENFKDELPQFNTKIRFFFMVLFNAHLLGG